MLGHCEGNIPAQLILALPPVTAKFHANNALAAARDATEAARSEFHTMMLKVKTAIIAQYGPDADAVRAIGLKKKFDYRRSGRRRSAGVTLRLLIMRVRSSRSIWITIRMRPRSDCPILTKRPSVSEWTLSRKVNRSGSLNTVFASSKLTLCLR